MDEWLAVVLAGALGGGVSTLLPAGTESPWPRSVEQLLEQRVYWSLASHLLRNTLVGGLASFVVWGLANPGLDFGSGSVTVGEAASAIIVGGGGVSLLNNLFQQGSRIRDKDQGIEAAEALIMQDTGTQDDQDR
jgi:hypothetical protein